MVPIIIHQQTMNSVAGAIHRQDWRLLTQLLSDPAKHDKAEMARALIDTADRGYVECTRVLLQAGTNTNMHDAGGVTPLIIAAKKGHTEVVKLLLNKEYKTRINKASFHIRATALHWAATHGHADIVSHLVAAGADVMVTTIHGRTPLMLAARCGETEIVNLLIQQGSRVSERDFEGATALHFAAEEGADSCARALLKSEADINAQTNTGDTPLLCAARKGRTEVLKMLLHRSMLNMEARSQRLSALHWAALGGSAECVEALVYRGMGVDTQTADSHYSGTLIVNEGVTPMMLAAERGHEDVVETLLRLDARIDLRDAEGKTALIFAIQKQHTGCVRALLQGGADPDGAPPQRASRRGNHQDDIYDDFEEEHEDEDENHSITPIFMAIKKDNVALVKLLLQANCDLRSPRYLTGSLYVTPLEFAMSKRHFRLARLLVAAGSGADIVGAHTMMLQEALAHLLLQDEREFECFAELFHTPPPLLQLARNRIRKLLGHDIQRVLPLLPLPPVLQSYVNLNDLDDLV